MAEEKSGTNGTQAQQAQNSAGGNAAAAAAKTGGAGAEQNRTFTQAELDAIVGDRLARERAKYPDYEALKAKAAQYDAAEEARKTDLQKAQEAEAKVKAELDALKKANAARDARDKVAAETGVPANLLTAATEEECRAQAKAILDWRGKQPNYPTTGDGGEQNINTSGGKTRDSFATWFNSETGKR